MIKGIPSFIVLLIFFHPVSGQLFFKKSVSNTYYYGANAFAAICANTDGSCIVGTKNQSIVKLDANGNVIWNKLFSAYQLGLIDIKAITSTGDGGYIIASTLLNYPSSQSYWGYDIYLIRTNAIGDTLWTKIFGDYANETPHSIKQTSDGGFIIAGSSNSFGLGANDMLLVKLNSMGNTEWSYSYGRNATDEGYDVEETSDGGFIAVGSTYTSGAGNKDVYVIRTDINGDTLWTQAYGGTNIDEGRSIIKTTDGNYMIVGSTQSFGAGSLDVYVLKITDSGSLLWSKTFGGYTTDYGNSITRTNDNNYLICGTTFSFGAGISDIYLLTIEENGDTVCTRTIGTPAMENGYCAVPSSNNKYWVLGNQGAFGLIAKVGSSCKLSCSNFPVNTQVSLPSTQSSYTSTYVFPALSLSPFHSTVLGHLGCQLKDICVNASKDEETFEAESSTFFIYPNPITNHQLKISYLLAQNQKGLFEMFDVTGKKVFSYALPQWSTMQYFLLPGLAGGIYNCIITSGGERVSRKVAVVKE